MDLNPISQAYKRTCVSRRRSSSGRIGSPLLSTTPPAFVACLPPSAGRECRALVTRLISGQPDLTTHWAGHWNLQFHTHMDESVDEY